MNHKQLVELVKQAPAIWDRNCPVFRDREEKERAWDRVAQKINLPVNTCKDSFKSLREKYLREREKAVNHHADNHYSPWELLDDLAFLDPHIVPRTTTARNMSEDDLSLDSDYEPPDFDRQLIQLVKRASPIWDRNSNTYPNKASKKQLWDHIGHVLRRDVGSCMLRWKALREKYIRQKAKYIEGETKWELLDELQFLDKVIQYRRKTDDYCVAKSSKRQLDGYFYPETHHHQYDYLPCKIEDAYTTDSSNDYGENGTVQQQMADSSYSPATSKRLRNNSTGSSYAESSLLSDKKTKCEEAACKTTTVDDGGAKERSPEQLFGELVASLLSKKPENQRNTYMVEIMTVLSK